MNRRIVILSLFVIHAFFTQAQSLNNIYDDVIQIHKIRNGGKPFAPAIQDKTAKIIAKYFPAVSNISTVEILKTLIKNPIINHDASIFDLDADHGARLVLNQENYDLVQKNIGYSTFITTSSPYTLAATSTAVQGPGFNAPAIADALTQLIIERAKEELTATFFQRLKDLLQKNPELSAAFPKTTSFIGHIETYLYASYLPVLREAFISDVNGMPMQIGEVLRCPRIKAYIQKNPKLQSVWYVIPALKCLGDLKNGKSIGDAIKDLNPDDELYLVDQKAFNILRIFAALSESIRDSSGKQNWVKTGDLTALLSDATDKALFFALLYQEMDYQPKIAGSTARLQNFISVANQTKIIAIFNDLITAYSFVGSNLGTLNDLGKAYKEIGENAANGKSVDFDQLIKLTNGFEKTIANTWSDINDLSPDPSITATVDSVFRDIPKVIEVIGDFKSSKYSLGVMNTVLIIDQYVRPKNFLQKPFVNLVLLAARPDNTTDINTVVKDIDIYLSNYFIAHPDDDLKSLIAESKKIQAFTTSVSLADQQKALNALFLKISAHTFQLKSKDFDGYNIYQQMLKYGTLMAALTQAQNAQEAKEALNAAILPVGSSSIKYYTAFSFSINSYIGGAYYSSNYQQRTTSSNLNFNTIGVALPVGVNFSVSTRSQVVGAVSLFASVVDLGAVASYRLSNPSNSDTQTLPAFTFQNLLAPGLFMVFNRIGNTPVAFGFGAQRAPQLNSITTGNADLNSDPKWRVGAFLSVDIPLFNLYSKSLKRPLD